MLLIAEAPPSAVDRYFYFPDVWSHDSLFREVVRAVLRREPTRKGKPDLLEALKEHRVFLIDACLDPLDGPLSIDVGRLIARARRLDPRRIIVVKTAMFKCIFAPLRDAGLPVIDARIPFPGSGQQVRFREEMRRALRKRSPRTNEQDTTR